VLDTSAWVAAYRAEVAANLLDLFRMVVPQAVIDEVAARDPAFPAREYPYATLFRHLAERMTVVPAAEAPEPLPVFGAGEAAALALARGRGCLVLVNEWRAAEHAANLGLRVVTIPTVIVRLHMAGVISRRAAHRKLDLIGPITSAGYLDEARRLVDEAGLA
jgi:predicted nucleic acid-binding protein